MKRVVFSLSFFFLLTLSTAFRVTKLDLSRAIKLSDHDRRIKPSSSDGSDSSTIESYPVPDHTESQKTETITSEDLDHLKRMKWVPVQSRSGLNQYYFLTNRFKPHKCRHHHHLLNRHPIRFVGENEVRENEVRFATVHEKKYEDVDFPIEAKVLRHRHVARDFPELEGDEPKMDDQIVRPHYMIPHHRLRHRHHHHHSNPNGEEDAEGVEVKEAVNEDEIKEQHKDDEHEDREKYILKKIGKFMGYF